MFNRLKTTLLAVLCLGISACIVPAAAQTAEPESKLSLDFKLNSTGSYAPVGVYKPVVLENILNTKLTGEMWVFGGEDLSDSKAVAGIAGVLKFKFATDVYLKGGIDCQFKDKDGYRDRPVWALVFGIELRNFKL